MHGCFGVAILGVEILLTTRWQIVLTPCILAPSVVKARDDLRGTAGGQKFLPISSKMCVTGPLESGLVTRRFYAQ